MIQIDNIKLVIWDLDETFWEGTLSEGAVTIPKKNIELIKALTDIGIVNSICSKNEWTQVKEKLVQENLLDFFVFPSVDWNPKGDRVRQLISDIQLRPSNVLFLDDNPSNRQEVKYYCPKIMTESPDIIPELIRQAKLAEKKDPNHNRLKQYHVLESKKEARTHFSSNEDFLMDSNIQLVISYDCENHVDRIHDLVIRSNQLNFTKNRSSKDELKQLIDDPSVKTGIVSVTDDFGDYGIVGFFAVKDNVLIHFVFSCRTLGMGIEQYAYNYLGRPILTIVGEVVSDLSSEDIPAWINQKRNEGSASTFNIEHIKKHTVLIKGPCDLFQIYPYIANTELLDTEFSHVTDSGIAVDSTSHTTHMVEAIRLEPTEKQRVVDEVPFIDLDIYSDRMYKNPYEVIFISILTDANLGIYKRKETGERFAFAEYIQPITDKNNWDKLINGELQTNNFHFTREILESFASKYEFIGRNSPDDVVHNLEYIRSHLNSNCLLVVMLGGELYYEKNTFEAYEDRHIIHKKMNDSIREWASTRKNVRLLDVNKYLVDQNSFYDHFNHYIKPVYYALAKEMVGIINEHTGAHLHETSRLKMVQVRLKEILAPYYYRLFKKR